MGFSTWCFSVGRIWAHTGPYGPIWAHTGPDGPIWAPLGPTLKQHLLKPILAAAETSIQTQCQYTKHPQSEPNANSQSKITSLMSDTNAVSFVYSALYTWRGKPRFLNLVFITSAFALAKTVSNGRMR